MGKGKKGKRGTPPDELRKMWRRFSEAMDPASLGDVEAKADDFFKNGATSGQVDALRAEMRREIGERLTREYRANVTVEPDGVKILTKSGVERTTTGILERNVRAPPSWGPGAVMRQVIDAATGKILSQRKVIL